MDDWLPERLGCRNTQAWPARLDSLAVGPANYAWRRYDRAWKDSAYLPRNNQPWLITTPWLATFIYYHLYSTFSIVQCSNALYRLWDGEIQGHTSQPSVREIDAHTMHNQWATALGRILNYPRPKSITHLRTFSDNGVYVALQLFLVILVSDQWRRVLIPYSYRQAPWGLLHARGWLSRYSRDQRLYVVSKPRETHSPMLKARFLHLTILVAGRIEPPTSWLPGQRVTTRPQLSHYMDLL